MNFVRRNMLVSFLAFQFGIVAVMTAIMGPSPVHASPNVKRSAVVMPSMEIIID